MRGERNEPGGGPSNPFFLARQTALICRAKVITIVPSFQITVNSGEPITLYVAGASVMPLSCGLEPVRWWVSSTLCSKMELLKVYVEKKWTP